MSFDLLVEKAVTDGYVEIFKTPFGPVNEWDAFALSLDTTGMTLSGDRYDGNPTPVVIKNQVVATNAELVGNGFHHVVFDVDVRGASTKRCVVTVDAETPPAVELPSTHTNESPADILWGVTYTNTTTTYDGLYFDDFVVTAP